MLLIGPSGVGKSHIAAALGHHLIERGVRVKWFSACDLVKQLQKAKKELDLMTYMTRLDKYTVLGNQPQPYNLSQTGCNVSNGNLPIYFNGITACHFFGYSFLNTFSCWD